MSKSIPEGWKSQKLGDLLVSLPKSRHPSGVSDEKGYFNFYVCSSDIQKSFKCDVKEPSVLFSTGGEAAIHYATGKYSFSTDVWATKFTGNLTNEFVFRYLSLIIDKINYLGFQGSGIKHLDKDFIKKLNFAFPSLAEQKKIASILTSVDEVIEKTQLQINKLQDLKKATMNELLTKGIGHTEFKESELGRIPKSWECLSVGQMLEKELLLVVKDGNHGSQYPRTSEFQKHGIPFLAASSIDENGVFIIDSLPHLSLDRAARLRIPNAKCGDVILTHNATVGRVSIIPDNIKEVIASTSTTYYRVNPNKLCNKFLRVFFESLPFQNQLRRIMGQTTRNQVPITAQKDLFVLYSGSISEQEEISSIINLLRDQLSNVQNKLVKLKSLKKSLMQDLLTGKVRVKIN